MDYCNQWTTATSGLLQVRYLTTITKMTCCLLLVVGLCNQWTTVTSGLLCNQWTTVTSGLLQVRYLTTITKLTCCLTVFSFKMRKRINEQKVSSPAAGESGLPLVFTSESSVCKGSGRSVCWLLFQYGFWCPEITTTTTVMFRICLTFLLVRIFCCVLCL